MDRFETSDPGFYPNASQREQALSTERYADGRRNRVQQLNNQNDGNTYSINARQNACIISRGGKQTKKAYAYEIHVKKSWNHEIVYEECSIPTLWIWEPSRRSSMPVCQVNENEDGYV